MWQSGSEEAQQTPEYFAGACVVEACFLMPRLPKPRAKPQQSVSGFFFWLVRFVVVQYGRHVPAQRNVCR